MLERLARDKHSSLLQKSVNYDRKKLYITGPGENIMRCTKKPNILSNIKPFQVEPLSSPFFRFIRALVSTRRLNKFPKNEKKEKIQIRRFSTKNQCINPQLFFLVGEEA